MWSNVTPFPELLAKIPATQLGLPTAAYSFFVPLVNFVVTDLAIGKVVSGSGVVRGGLLPNLPI